ncbi:hypothetical protein BUALT_Bualt01G0033700 [Buddleja alternifolia]|uniref:Ubiquitin-like domain-containing protein n=1 Tax=Buddleja alternifolia TaxID=168488 RepID=A0AAV6YB38_9LAMI|nr:hypothetical protein BUALT_Bualt01G0033700 [Buddleja alternifolia]
MKLVIEILTGSLFYVEVGEDATVANLKKQIGDQENLPTDRLILMLDAADQQRYLLVNDETSVKDYGVKDSSHIYLFFEPLNDEPGPESDDSNEPPNEHYDVISISSDMEDADPSSDKEEDVDPGSDKKDK